MLNKLSAFKLILNNKLNLDYIINFYFVLYTYLHAWNNYNAAETTIELIFKTITSSLRDSLDRYYFSVQSQCLQQIDN